MIRAAVSGSLLILMVVLIRAFFRKLPGRIRVILWILCGLRLALPFTFTISLPILQQSETAVPVVVEATATAPVETVSPDNSELVLSQQEVTQEQKINLRTVLFVLYAAGVVFMLLFMFGGMIRIRRRTRFAVPKISGETKYYACEGISSPFVFGVVRPRIYVPFDLGEEELPFVLSHEAYHIRYGHHVCKMLFYLVLSFYWFDPFVWLAWCLLGRDIEIACDEGVTRDYDTSKRNDYAHALLSVSAVKNRLLSAQVTFGEISLRNRVERVLVYQPVSPRKMCLLMILPIVLAAMFFVAAVPVQPYVLQNDEENFGYDVLRNGKDYGFFSYNDPVVIRDADGVEWLYNNYLGGQAYRKIRMDDALRQGIIAAVDKNMYYVRDPQDFEQKTDPVTGLSYLYPAGYRSWTGAVIIEDDHDEKVFRKLMERYKKDYPELLMEDDVADIYAAMEVKGLCFRDRDGFVIVGNGGVQAINLSDPDDAWNVFFSPGEYGRLDDWLQEHRDTFLGTLDFESWRPVFDELSISYYDGELDTGSKRYAAAYQKLLEGFGQYPPDGMSAERAQEQLFNWMKYYDEDGDYTGSDGIAGMDATGIDPADRQVIIEIPEEFRQKLFDLRKEEFLKWKGMSRPETKRSEVFREYQISAEKQDRLKGTWTLQQYEQCYVNAFVEAAKSSNPSWDYGDDFDESMLSPITREDVEKRIISNGKELKLEGGITE